MAKKQTAAKTRLLPGEHSIDRVHSRVEKSGSVVIDWAIRLPDGKLVRRKSRGRTVGEAKARAKESAKVLLSTDSSTWKITAPIIDYIDSVSMNQIIGARLAENSKKRYLAALTELRSLLVGYSIADASRFRTLEKTLKTIAERSPETAHQARTVLSKYVLDQLIRDGLIPANPIRGIAIDVTGDRPKADGPKALTAKQYNDVVGHLLLRDVQRPIPPRTDKRATSINLHGNAVRLALLQAATGLRISEALALWWSDLIITDDYVAVPVRDTTSKTRRGRTVPVIHKGVEARLRLEAAQHDPREFIVPKPSDPKGAWRTDNAVKATRMLYKDVATATGVQPLEVLRSHLWRATLNTITAGTVPLEVRAAFFGHTEAINKVAYTDLTDVSIMRTALASRKP